MQRINRPQAAMPLQLDTSMCDTLDRILSAAASVLKEAHDAYQQGRLNGEQIECVFHLRNDLGQLIARFSDGQAYTGSDYHYNALGAMRCYEQMADSWLAAVYAAVGADQPLDACQRTGPGRYVVTRTRETAQGVLVNSIPCTNPAVATLRLDLWESAREAH